jgi:FMN phosphatase YigB (HAD superfamily)
MVGDSLTADIAGAAACGVHTCLYAPAAPSRAGTPVPEHTVTALMQLTALL